MAVKQLRRPSTEARAVPAERRAFAVRRTPEPRCAQVQTTVKNRVTELSASERKVLVYTALGFSTQDTATKLGRSTETIKSQRESILRKLGARNMTHAITICFAPALIDRFS